MLSNSGLAWLLASITFLLGIVLIIM
ncbi:hypothetical protein LCGC14_3107300, partial [marine sediment metagenome]